MSTTTEVPQTLQWTLDGKGLTVNSGDLEGVLWEENEGDMLSVVLTEGENGLAIDSMELSRASGDESLAFAYDAAQPVSYKVDEQSQTHLCFVAETMMPRCFWKVAILGNAGQSAQLTLTVYDADSGSKAKVARASGSGSGGGYNKYS